MHSDRNVHIRLLPREGIDLASIGFLDLTFNELLRLSDLLPLGHLDFQSPQYLVDSCQQPFLPFRASVAFDQFVFGERENHLLLPFVNDQSIFVWTQT